MSSSRIISSLAFLTALIITGIFAWQMFLSLQFFNKINDLPEYFVAAKLALEGNAPSIYKAAEFYAAQERFFPGGGHGVLLFLPPPAIVWLLFLALIPASLAPAIWTVALSLSLIAALVLIARFYSLRFIDATLLWSATLFSGPAVDAVRIGQLAPLLLLAFVILLFSLIDGSAVTAGVALSFFLCKPQQIIPFAVFLLANRKFAPFAVAGGIATVFSIASLALLGADTFNNYLHLIADPASLKIMQPELNPTFKGQLLRLFGAENSAVSLTSYAMLAASSLFIFFLGRRTAGKEGWLKVGLLGAVPIGLATSIHCHYYDLLLLIPSIVLSIQTSSQDMLKIPGHMIIKCLAIFTACAFLFPIYTPIRYEYLMKGGIIDPIFIILSAYAIASAVGCWKATKAEPKTTQSLS